MSILWSLFIIWAVLFVAGLISFVIAWAREHSDWEEQG